MLAGFAATACGSGAPSGPGADAVRRGPSTAAPEASGPPPPADSILPDVEAIEVASGDRVNVASLVPSDKPLLLWFWAPH